MNIAAQFSVSGFDKCPCTLGKTYDNTDARAGQRTYGTTDQSRRRGANCHRRDRAA
jgi:hypothetical protein